MFIALLDHVPECCSTCVTVCNPRGNVSLLQCRKALGQYLKKTIEERAEQVWHVHVLADMNQSSCFSKMVTDLFSILLMRHAHNLLLQVQH